MATNKTALSKNIAEHSTLNDISEFGFDFEGQPIERATSPKGDYTEGNWYPVRCVGYERWDGVRTVETKDGSYEIQPCHEFKVVGIASSEESIIRVNLGKLKSFAYGIDKRSGGDLSQKIQPYTPKNLNDEALKNLGDRESEEAKKAIKNARALATYLNRCPVKLCYDRVTYTDKDTNETVTSGLAFRYWVPADFQTKQASDKLTF